MSGSIGRAWAARARHGLWMAVVCAGVVACGGGGGGGSDAGSSGTPGLGGGSAATPVRQETNPGGARIDRRADNYFAMADGDRWTYQVTRNGFAGQPVDVSISAVGGALRRLETQGSESGYVDFERSTDGVRVLQPFSSGLPAAARQVVGSVLVYAEPFYPVGSVRKLLSRGSYGEDLDGDGSAETLQFEMEQTFAGFFDHTLDGHTVQAARLQTLWRFTVRYSSGKYTDYVYTASEDEWFAPGVGLVRVLRSARDSTGAEVVPEELLTLSSAVVGGVAFGDARAANFTTRQVALTHRALVHDATRNLFYASVPGNVVASGNRIAVLDPASGAVRLSDPVGSEPGAMAVAADGSALFVGLNGSGEVVQLSLPGLTVSARVRLPVDSFFGQMVAETIATSPTDPTVVAVSLAYTGSSPRHAGVALLRSMQLQPQRTQTHTGSNLIAFGADGTQLYGYNNETTEFGLRRIEVLADGLVERVVQPFGSYFYVRHLDRIGNLVLVDNRVATVPDLQLAGTVAGGRYCRVMAGSRPPVVCIADSQSDVRYLQLSITDTTSFATQATLNVPRTSPGGTDYPVLIPGAAGTLAVREGISHPATDVATGVRLVTSDLLRPGS